MEFRPQGALPLFVPRPVLVIMLFETTLSMPEVLGKLLLPGNRRDIPDCINGGKIRALPFLLDRHSNPSDTERKKMRDIN